MSRLWQWYIVLQPVVMCDYRCLLATYDVTTIYLKLFASQDLESAILHFFGLVIVVPKIDLPFAQMRTNLSDKVPKGESPVIYICIIYSTNLTIG